MRVTVLLTGLLVACGASHAPDAGGDAPDAACAPDECGLRCGDVPDGCGGTLSCPCPECASDADCDADTVCDLGHGVCTTDCRTGPHAAIDIPLVEVDLDVTLNGAPLPAEPALVGLWFVRRDIAPEIGATVSLYDDAGPVTPLRASLAPGEYAVHYTNTLGSDDAGPWPSDIAQLTVVDVTRDTTTLAIDVRSTPVRFDVTLDGAPLPGDRGTVGPWIYASRADSRGRRGMVWARRLPADASSFAIHVIPGLISFAYAPGAALPDWPLAGAIAENVDVGASPVVALDIARARLTVRLTRDGVPAPDGVQLALEAPDSAPVPLGVTEGGELTAYVVPGTIRLLSMGGPTDWPDEEWRIAETTVTGDTTLDVNVDPVLVPIDARLDATWNDGCAAGAVTVSGHRIRLPTIGETVHHDVSLFRGEKRVEYRAPAMCVTAPLRPSVVLDPIGVIDASPQSIVVPTVRVTFDVTLDPSPDGWIVPAFGDDLRPTITFRAIRGRYDVVYGNETGWSVQGEGPLPPPNLPLGCWEL
ncbi:MAG: hypothetical protein AB7S26_21130 [Sandaracinaceae bacterium]